MPAYEKFGPPLYYLAAATKAQAEGDSYLAGEYADEAMRIVERGGLYGYFLGDFEEFTARAERRRKKAR